MEQQENGTGARPRGRPRRDIDRSAVADAVAELFAEGGIDAVSIAPTAEKLGMSRATLYRTVPTKEDLVGILFERETAALHKAAKTIVRNHVHVGEQLHHLVRLQIEAAINMRSYMPVFFGGVGLPGDVFQRWHSWSKRYEKLWANTVSKAMDEGILAKDDPTVTTRLLLGMCIWVSRWFRPNEPYRAEDIAEAAVKLIGPLTAEN